jgi:two-component system NtrC family sensor kinase
MSAESPAIAAAIPATASSGAVRPPGLSLRSKGALAFAAIVLYLVAVVAVTNREHQTHERYFIDIEEIAASEAAVGRLTDAVDHSERVLLRALDPADSDAPPAAEVTRQIEEVRVVMGELSARFPAIAQERLDLERALAGMAANPSRAALMTLWDIDQRLEDGLHGVAGSLAQSRSDLKARYLEAHKRVSEIALAHVLAGALIFGALIFGFFNRLTRDIRATEDVATQVARGFRGALPPVTRSDELGGLMQSITDMQSELRQHEQKSEVARELRFHQEKMAAVGWMAAAVAHEINNPIAAIAGIAQDMMENGAGHHEPGREPNFGGPRMILAQTERIGAISRQIAEFTSPPVTEPALFDLNAVVRNTCTFVGYDRRLRGVRLDFDLDSTLPATFGVADHVTQVLINLVINSADALDGVTDRAPVIRVTTRHVDDSALLTVEDNGHGMDAAVQARAFEEMFTTKPAGRGRGLGLFMCRSLVERDRGRIELSSVPGAGATVRVHLPLQPAAS